MDGSVQEILNQAITAAERAFPEMRAMPAHRRRAILQAAHGRLAAEKDKFARLITSENQKPIRDSSGEVGRALFTLTLAVEEAGRMNGELLPMDLVEAGERRLGLVRRFPIGPIAAITPFNFPLNLVLHKVAPALASGNTVVVKPSPRTPQTAIELGRLFQESGLPDGALTVLPPEACGADVAVAMACDPRFKMLTFTGSADVGWSLKAKAGKKRVVLELGGNSGTIVHSDADLEHAVGRIVAGGFGFSGQSCVAVQRVFVERGVYRQFLELIVPRVRQLKVGDPFDETTDVGPMIDLPAAERAESWIQEAVAQGAKLLAGGGRDGRMIAPAVLVDTRSEMLVNCREVFAPLVTVTPYDRFEEALDLVNQTNFGLHAGVFTRDNARIFKAFETLEVGGVIVNDVPTYRVDHMPYGGAKDSGFGREGIRYAIEEMTEPRIMVLNLC